MKIYLVDWNWIKVVLWNSRFSKTVKQWRNVKNERLKSTSTDVHICMLIVKINIQSRANFRGATAFIWLKYVFCHNIGHIVTPFVPCFTRFGLHSTLVTGLHHKVLQHRVKRCFYSTYSFSGTRVFPVSLRFT